MALSDKETIARGTPSRTLVMRASEGALPFVPRGKTVIFCGSGNNGADGYCIATLLHKRGDGVKIIKVKEPRTEEAVYYSKECDRLGILITDSLTDEILNGADTAVDCIFGTGFKGSPDERSKAAIELINGAAAYKISMDIPSGLDSNSGAAKCAVKADMTVAVQFMKAGHLLNSGMDLCGKINVIDIGIAASGEAYLCPDAEDLAPVFPKRLHNSHKGSYGTGAVFGGSENYVGALKLSAMANSALRSGAGISRIVCPEGIKDYILSSVTECTAAFVKGERSAVFDPGSIDGALKGIDSLAFGMGIGRSTDAVRITEYILKTSNVPVIVDADGLFSLKDADISGVSCPVTVTPHPLEMARLIGATVSDVLADPIAVAKEYALKTGFIVLLKGASTVVTDGGRVYIVNRGAPGMATAGSGDVLSGILAGIYASKPSDLLLATAAGAYIAGRAGELAEEKFGAVSQIASDTVRFIPDAVKEIYAYSK